MTQQSQRDLAKIYEPKQVEGRLYEWWLQKGFFRPDVDSSKPPFVIIMPPPNVTGDLHIGHALTASIEDALIRWRRMKGDSVLWLPGTDHAGIATQMVVERQLMAEGLDRHTLGRELFVERVWEWVRHYGNNISLQHRSLGASCDWSRECFTLDPGPSKAVRTTFVNLYNKGLIYRGERLINWSPGLQTALSDLEVEYREVKGSLWHMRYPLVDGGGYVTVATTRPETYLGDTAVAVHPADGRHQGLIGKRVSLPILEREIPIIADEHVDPKFGTGFVKVTPAHDPNDFEIGRRHGLAQINVMNPDATINENGGPFRGQDRYAARDDIVAQFERLGLLEKVEPHTHSVGHCQRSNTVVEPILSTQWFLNVGSYKDAESIVGRAHNAVASGAIAIEPPRFRKVYLNWLENIRDWCISRQLWWGHRIPVWHCTVCHHMTTAVQDPTECAGCQSSSIEQDSDVLDTWFSSGLWPHSTLGWPEDTDDLRYFYPTAVMETGYDILFFWVARMIMMGLENTGQIPFRKVYLHGLIRDASGEKMSKVKGNVVNPLEMIDEYGTDALRFALTTGTAPGNDSRISREKLEASRNFANKLWNVCRYVLTAVGSGTFYPELPTQREVEDRWILSRLNRTIGQVEEHLDHFQLGEAQREIYDFLWNEYADWYIELAKVRLRSGTSPSPLPVLVHVLDNALRLLHPFMPFVTEEAWQRLLPLLPAVPRRGESIMVSAYPLQDSSMEDEGAERDMELFVDVVTAIRNARAELEVEPGKKVEVIVDAGTQETLIASKIEQVRILAKADPVQVYGGGDTVISPKHARVSVLGGVRVIVPVQGLVDLDGESDRLKKQCDELKAVVSNLQGRLENEQFVKRAPSAVVAKERARLVEYVTRVDKLEERLRDIDLNRTGPVGS